MHRPWRAIAMAILVSHALSCAAHTGDRGEAVDVASISARWSLRNLGDGAATSCPSGFDTAQLIAQPIDESGAPVGPASIDLFDCEARSGGSTDLAPELYQVWIEVRSHDLASLYAQSLSQILDVRGSDRSFSTDILNDGGYFQLAWDLVGGTTNRPLDCSSVAGLDSILAVSTSVTDAHRVYEDRRLCDDHAGVSEGLLHGAYTITIDAMAGAQSLGTAMTLTHQTIAGQNRVTDLGTIVIPINGL